VWKTKFYLYPRSKPTSYIEYNAESVKGDILRSNCHLKHVIERKIKGKRRRERRCKQLLMIVRQREDTVNWRGDIRSYSLENSSWNSL
jgi:hypothetical protein